MFWVKGRGADKRVYFGCLRNRKPILLATDRNPAAADETHTANDTFRMAGTWVAFHQTTTSDFGAGEFGQADHRPLARPGREADGPAGHPAVRPEEPQADERRRGGVGADRRRVPRGRRRGGRRDPGRAAGRGARHRLGVAHARGRGRELQAGRQAADRQAGRAARAVRPATRSAARASTAASATAGRSSRLARAGRADRGDAADARRPSGALVAAGTTTSTRRPRRPSATRSWSRGSPPRASSTRASARAASRRSRSRARPAAATPADRPSPSSPTARCSSPGSVDAGRLGQRPGGRCAADRRPGRSTTRSAQRRASSIAVPADEVGPDRGPGAGVRRRHPRRRPARRPLLRRPPHSPAARWTRRSRNDGLLTDPGKEPSELRGARGRRGRHDLRRRRHRPAAARPPDARRRDRCRSAPTRRRPPARCGRVELTADGGAVAVGAGGNINGSAQALLARYGPDGQPADSFGGGDGFTLDPGISEPHDIAVAADGTLLISASLRPEPRRLRRQRAGPLHGGRRPRHELRLPRGAGRDEQLRARELRHPARRRRHRARGAGQRHRVRHLALRGRRPGARRHEQPLDGLRDGDVDADRPAGQERADRRLAAPARARQGQARRGRSRSTAGGSPREPRRSSGPTPRARSRRSS